MRLLTGPRQRAWSTMTIVAAVVLVLCCVASALAQDNTDVSAASAPDIDTLRDRLESISSRDDMDAAVRERVTDTYREAIAELESAANARDVARELRSVAAGAPDVTQRTNRELVALDPVPSLDALSDVPESALAARAETLGIQLSDTQSDLADLRDRLTAMAERPSVARRELAEARQSLRDLQVEPSGENADTSPLAVARRALNDARRAAMSARIAQLQQELSTADARQRVLEARRALAEARLARDTELLAQLQQALSLRQSDTATALRRDTQHKLSELRTAVPPISDVAQANVELANQLSGITDQSDALAQRLSVQRQRLDEMQQRLTLVTRQLEIGGTSTALGNVLRAQRREVGKPRWLDGSAGAPPAGDPDIASAELLRFQLQQQRADLKDLTRRVETIIDESGMTFSAGQRESLRALLEQRRAVIELLIEAQGRYISLARGLQASYLQYGETRDSFNRLLDERLFWLPSFQPLDLGWVARLVGDLPWVFDIGSWRTAVNAFVSGLAARPVITGLAFTGLVMLMWMRRPLRRRLVTLAEPVGNVRRDTFWVTLQAALITVTLFVPMVAVLWLAGYFVRAGSGDSIFTTAVSAVFVQLAVLVLFVEPFVQVCRKYGLAESHFLWRDSARHALYRALRWVLALLVLPTVLVTFTEAFDDDGKRETIGRGAFMLGSLIISGSAAWLLHPRRGVLAHVLGDDEKSLWRLGYLWLPIAAGVPLLLTGLAAWGYYYTALQLQSRFFYSAGLLGGSVVSYSLIVRILTVAERRLALVRALRRREEAREARAARDAALAAGEGAPENLDALEIDLVQISEQTRGLIKVVTALLVGATLWFIWSDTLPALQLLDTVTLWQYATEIDGESHLTRVTLGALLLSLVVGVVTALAGRNLPGFLEITVLRRFSMDAGSRYAMATLFQYAIVIVGLLVAVGIIGLRWSSIQWLVAAIGVGLGFGLQEIFANFVSGIVILFERPVRVGDTVTVGTLTGTVSRIRIRATTVTDWDNKEVVIPNKTFITETVINWTLSDDITRLIFRVKLALDTDTDLAQQLIMDVIRDEPVALDNPAPTVFFVGYDDSALIYEARIFYHDIYNMLPLTDAIYRGMHNAFRANDVTVSFPQHDLHLRSVSEAAGEALGKGREQTGQSPQPDTSSPRG